VGGMAGVWVIVLGIEVGIVRKLRCDDEDD
jgi:hypothetical protein